MEGHPNIVAILILVAYPPLAFGAFAALGPRRGALGSLLGGWLFLPQFDGVIDLPILHTRAMLVSAVVLLASLAFDFPRWWRYRPRWVDLPIATLALAPVGAALSNDLGAYEAGSAALEAALVWAVPYLLARLYFGEPRALEDLAMAVVVAALVYAPLCLWEIRMSPQLHLAAFGFRTSGSWTMAIRMGGYRPIVFLAHGLAVGMFMASGALAALWLWRTGARRTLGGIRFGWLALLLAATTVLCKSTGSIVLLAVGYVALEATRWLRTTALVLVLLAVPPAYCVARVLGWRADEFASAADRAFGADRAQSLQFRLMNEDLVIAKALQRPALGWGRFGRARVYDDMGRDITIVDGQWIVQLGVTGLTGLVALGLLLALPAVMLLVRFPARAWADRRLAPAACLAMLAALWAIDDLFNAMMSPIYPAAAGAVLTLAVATRKRHRPEPAATGEPIAIGGPAAWAKKRP